MRCLHVRGWIGIAVIAMGFQLPMAAQAQTVVAPGGDLAQALQNANAGDIVQLGAGTYVLDESLVFANSGVTLRGQADGSSRLVFSDTVQQAGVDTALIDLTGRSNITLQHLSLDGESRANGASYGVYAFEGSGHEISHLNVTQLSNPGEFGPIGVYFNGSVSDSVIRQSSFTDIGINDVFGSGIRVHGDSDHNLIEYNTIDRTGRGGIFALGNNDGAPADRPTLDGLVIRHNVVTNSALASSTADGFADLGIEVQNDIRDAVIEDNVVDKRVSIDNAQRVAVRRNTVTQADNTAVVTGSYGLEIVDAQDILATDNQVLGDVHLGVSISGDGDTRHALFANNLIQNATTFGVQIQGRDDANAAGVAEDLYFLQNQIIGTLGGDDALFTGTGDGVRFNMAFDDITLDGNSLTGHAGEDLFLNDTPAGSLVTLGNNTTDDPYADGDGLDVLDTPLTQETFTADLGETITVTFDNLTGNITHVLWDLGQGAPITTSTASITLNPDLLGDSQQLVVVAWDDQGDADTAVIVVIPEPAMAGLGLLGLLILTLRANRRSAPWPSSL